MILPPDSKNPAGPQSSSSETAEGSSRPTTPTPRSPTTTETTSSYYPNRPLPYSQAYRSPHGTSETSPLLDHPDYHGPAPPYSPHDPTSSSSSSRLDDIAAKTSAISRTRRRFWMALPCAILIYVAVLLVADLIVDLIPDIDYRPGDPDRHHGGRGGGGTPDEQERDDGKSIDCISWTPKSWKEYQRGRAGDKFFMSQSKTTYVNANSIDENFLHLAGPGAVAKVSVDTWPSYSAYGGMSSAPPPAGLPRGGHHDDDEVVILGGDADAELEDDLDDDQLRALYGARGMIRIVVEPIIRVFDPSSIPDVENSPGLEMLQESKVCVMQKDGSPVPPPKNATDSAPPRHKHRGSPRGRGFAPPPPPEKPLTSQGLGIYTHRPGRWEKNNDRYSDALRFNIYISLPEEYPPTFMELLLIAMGYEVPRGYVRSFEIRGDVVDISVNAAQQRTGRFLLNTAVGSVDFKNFVAEYVKVTNEAGSIAGTIDVSSMLDLSTESGGIDVKIGLSPVSSEGIIWTPPGVDPKSMRTSAGKGAELPAIVVNAHTQAGSIKMSYTKWSQISRGLKQNLKSELGAIQLTGHPVYEGPYRLTNNVGSISVAVDDSAKDPSERQRRRVGTNNRSGGLGNTCIWGEVMWTSDRGPRLQSSELEGDARVGIEGGGGWDWGNMPGICTRKGLDPGSDGYDPMASSLNAESSVGSIRVTL